MEALAQPKPNLYSSDKASCWGRNTDVSRVFKWSTPQYLRRHFFNIDQAKGLLVGSKHNWGTSRRFLKPKRSQFRKKQWSMKICNCGKRPWSRNRGCLEHYGVSFRGSLEICNDFNSLQVPCIFICLLCCWYRAWMCSSVVAG